jgi:hypothetical protein
MITTPGPEFVKNNDQTGARSGDHTHTDNASFEAAYPLALSGGVGVTEESLFPMMSAAENLNAAGLLIEQRSRNGNVHAMPVMQLCRSAMESSARCESGQ